MKGFLLFVTASMALAAVGQVKVTPSSGNTETMNKVKPGMGVNNQDRRYFTEAKYMTVYCLRLSELASRNGGAWSKEFGAMMVKDHAQNYAELKVIGSKVSMKVDKALPAAWQAKLNQAQKWRGGNFESQFRRAFISAKEMFSDQSEREVKSGNNSLIRNFAVTAGPVVRLHVKMAERKVTKI